MQLHVNQLVRKPPLPNLARAFDHWCLARLADVLDGVPVDVELWDGSSLAAESPAAVATVRIGDRQTLRRLLIRPTLEFGEAYSDGRIVVDGDLETLIETVNRARGPRPYPGASARRTRNVPEQSRRNVHAHYDLGNDFYRLWLDEQMAYTCAYYDRPEASLDEAQRAKFDLVCRKLQLEPGQHVVEAGCGWGGLALHMARHYGVTVEAYNISEPQLEFARTRAEAEGLASRVSFRNDDYRAVDGRCDAFVSIGMLEHVGPEHYDALGAVIDRVLDPRVGRGLLHFIGRIFPMEFNAWIAEHIFPGAYAPSLAEVLTGTLEPRNLSVVDVENLRLHYARTLEDWLARFEAARVRVREMYDESFVRTWRLYLASAQASFRTGHLQLFQVTFDRAADNTRPWTRDALYGKQSTWSDVTSS